MVVMFFLGRNFVSSLLCILKPKNLKELFPKKSKFFQAVSRDCRLQSTVTSWRSLYTTVITWTG